MKSKLALAFGLLIISFAASAQVTDDYRSQVTGDWNNVATWERWDGDSWEDAVAFPVATTAQTITIQNAHVVTVTATVIVDQVVIQSGGEVVINATRTWTLNPGAGDEFVVDAGGTLTNHGTIGFSAGARQATCNGTLNSDGAFTSLNGLDTFVMGATAVYNHDHLDAGVIPTATWDAASTVNIRGFDVGSVTAPTGLNQTFGNFIWNSPNMDGGSEIDLGGAPAIVLGDFTITDTGDGLLIYTLSTAPGLNIGGDFTNNGGFLYALTGASDGSFNITGDLNLTGGIFLVSEDVAIDLSVGGSLIMSGGAADLVVGGGTVTFDLAGNVTKTGGSFGSSGGVVNLNFMGGTTQTVSVNSAPTGTINYNVLSGTTLVLGATNFLAGTGTFTLNGDLHVASTHASGAIQTGTSNGNIRVSGTRTYVAGSTIVYNGASAQFMGNGHPTTSGVHTTINNSAGVSLTLDRTIGGNLTLTSGNLTVGASRTLTLAGTFTPNSNFLNVASSSNLIINGSGTFGTLATTGSTSITNFTMNRTSSGLVTLSTNLDVNGTFAQTAGDLDISGVTFTISNTYTRTAGNFRTNASSNLLIDGTSTLPASLAFFGASPAIGTLTMDRASASLTTSANLTITTLNILDGTFANSGSVAIAPGGTITREAGSMTGAPNNTSNTYNVVYNNSGAISAGPELPSNATALNNLTVQGSDAVTLGGSITINGILTLSGGSFVAGSNTVTMEGNFVSNAASSFGSSTVVFAGTTAISGGTSPVFGTVTVSNTLTHTLSLQVNGNFTNNGTYSGGSSTITFGGTTTILGSSTSSFNNITINASSALTAHATQMNVAGNFDLNATGTFTANGGVVNFNGTTSITGTPTFNGITLSGVLNAPATLTLTGHFTNTGSGTFNRGTGTVVFSGSIAQNIQGATSTTFNNITVTNASSPSVRVETNTNLAGVLTLSTSSTFDADGSGNTSVFTMLSSADAPTVDAAIATLPLGASVTGPVTVQRFMSIEGANNNRIYRYISSPVQSAPVSQIQTFIPVTGSFTGTSSCSGCGAAQSMFLYSESVITDINGAGGANFDDGYLDFPADLNSETLASGRGYAIYARGNVAPISTAGNALWAVTGVINSGTIDFVTSAGVTFTSSGTLANDGWNLVGNPYPSTIDWDAATGWSRTGVNNAIYMRDNGQLSPVYATYISGVGVNGGDNLIPIGQAFYVKSDGGPITFTADERVKVGGSQSTFFKEGSIENLLRIALKQFDVSDETAIRFHDNATAGFDAEFDADKLDNQSFNIFSRTPEQRRMAINTLPQLGCSAVVSVDVSNIAVGVYEMVFSEFETFSTGIQFVLTDNFLNESVDMHQNNVYAFEVTSDQASFTDRFTLTFSNKPVETDLALTGDPVCHGSNASVLLAKSQEGVQYTAYIGDAAVGDPFLGTGQDLSIDIPGDMLTAGENLVTVKGSFAACDAVLVAEPFVLSSEIIVDPTTETPELICGTGSVELSADGAPEGASYRWYTSETSTEFIPNQFSATYVTPLLTESRTYFVSIVNAAGCEGKHMPTTATVEAFVPVEISVETFLLTSSYASGNQWYRNDEKIEGATGKTLEPTESGVYRVEAKSGNCTTSAEVDFAVTSVEESAPNARYRIYPVPTTGLLNIEVESANPVQANINNLVGRRMATQGLRQEGSVQRTSIDMTDFASGVYILSIQDGDITYRKKIIRD